MAHPLGAFIRNVQKAAILVRVYNKPDSAMTRIAKRAKRRDKLFLQIRNIIAALI